MDWNLFWRHALDLAMLYPGAALCYLPVQNRLRLSPRRLFAISFGGLTALILGSALACMLLDIYSNTLIPIIFVLSFLVYRRTLAADVSTGQVAFVFTTMTALMAACTMLTSLLTAQSELGNADAACLASTSLLSLALSVVIILFFALFMRTRIVWLVEEFHAPRVWRIAWLLPALFTGLYILMLPWNPSTVLISRVQRLGVVLVIASLLMLQFLTFLFYRIARELTANARLAEENQMLSIEAHRYQELRAHMDETRMMRHDFRQHLRVISSLTDAGQTDELKQYLRQYDREFGGEHLSLCENAAVDAIAGHYHQYAVSHEIPIEWKLALPETLPLPETDICMLLGNLLENALRASGCLPAERRRVRVICQMLSPAMLGLIVENAYDGQLKKDGDIFLSTWHDGAGFGLQSVKNTVRRYHGKLTIETERLVFTVNVLLNL